MIGYIHGKLDERVEVKFFEYAKSGGRLVLLHHSISGGEAANRFLYGFLGIALTEPAKSREPSTPG